MISQRIKNVTTRVTNATPSASHTLRPFFFLYSASSCVPLHVRSVLTVGKRGVFSGMALRLLPSTNELNDFREIQQIPEFKSTAYSETILDPSPLFIVSKNFPLDHSEIRPNSYLRRKARRSAKSSQQFLLQRHSQRCRTKCIVDSDKEKQR